MGRRVDVGLGVRSFAKFADFDWFYAFEVNSLEIWRKSGVDDQFITFITSVRFLDLDANKTLLFWSGAGGVQRTVTATKTGIPTVVTPTPAVGLAVTSPWIYFTSPGGRLSRVALNGNGESVLATPSPPPIATGDVAVSPDGAWAHWGAGHDVLGLRLPAP